MAVEEEIKRFKKTNQDQDERIAQLETTVELLIKKIEFYEDYAHEHILEPNAIPVSYSSIRDEESSKDFNGG